MRHLPLIRLAAVVLLSAACGGADGVSGVDGTPKISPDATKIEAMIAALPDWVDNAPSPRAASPRFTTT